MRRLFALVLVIGLFSGLAAAQSSNIQVEKMMTEPEPLQTGQYATVWFSVTNEGDADAEYVNVTFEDRYPFTLKEDEDRTFRYRTIEPGDTYTSTVTVRVDRTAVSGNESLRFWMSHDHFDGRRSFSLPVEVRDDNTALTVRDVSLPERVVPGSTHRMNVTLQNNANTHFNSIDTRIDLPSEVPIVVSDTNRKRIQQLDGGDAVTLSYQLLIDEDADRGVYSIPITSEYVNIAGTTFSIQESTGVAIGGMTDIEAALERTDIRTDGTRGSVTVRLVNRGQGQAKFVSVDVPEEDENAGYELLSTNDIYIGNMIPDDYQTAEYEVYVEEGQESLTVPVDVSYVNAQGQPVERSFDVTVELYEQSALQQYGFVSSGGSMMPLIVVVLVVIGAGLWYWRRRGA
ncbi:MAG: hypothetical protein MUP66_03465 [Candidatus Nanohaloarchaeota archaeon QJJ-5]|nr:hypothetical protein [Candidatus Nanohaloarchaeota archaeon QJJ-5]